MAPNPLTLFVFITTAGNRIFKAAADRQQSGDLPDICNRGRPDSSSAQLLGNAVVCIAPIASVLRSQFFSQSVLGDAPMKVLDLVREAFTGLCLLLLSAWLLQHLPGCAKQVDANSDERPLQQSCSKSCAPQHGVTLRYGLPLTLLLGLWNLPYELVLFARRHWMRRRLYLHATVTRFEKVLPSMCATQPLGVRLPRPCQPGSHGLHDWHEAHPRGFLMPTAVAACREAPELRGPLQRLLADRWWALEEIQPMLEPISEDECVMGCFNMHEEEEVLTLADPSS